MFIYYVLYVQKMTANYKPIAKLIVSPDTSSVYGELRRLT